MKNLYLLWTCTLLLPVCLFAQGENDNWYFGNKAGLNFSISPPTVLLDSEMNNLEAVGVASKSNGELLFYTNGITIWNRDHGIMLTGLTSTHSTQQIFIVPHPNSGSLFYVFTMAQVGSTFSSIAYSIVDMNLGSIGLDGDPLGDVGPNNKNIPILDENGNTLTYKTEAISGTLHSDKQSFWILIPNGTKLYSYKVDGNGFNNLPVTSNLTFPSPLEYHGQIKISPNLPDNLGLPYTNFVSIARWSEASSPHDMRVHSFNNNTGLLTTDYHLQVSSINAYSTEFTSNGLLLYAGNYPSGIVSVFDLLGNPNNMVRQIFNPNMRLGSIQRAVNNEIYLSYNNNNYYISKIINPDSFASASVDQNNIYLLGRNCLAGLPQLIPQLESPPCPTDLVLNSPEQNNSFTYETSNTITTNQNYVVDVNQDITLSAGNAIEMQPNTLLKAGSVVLAIIDGCGRSAKNNKEIAFETVEIYIDLDGDEKKQLNVYPNPVKDKLNIQTDEVVTNVKIYDFSGTLLFQSTPGTKSPIIDMINFKSGIYFVEITIGNTTETVKVIK